MVIASVERGGMPGFDVLPAEFFTVVNNRIMPGNSARILKSDG